MKFDTRTLENSLVIFTDGSSLGNPGPGGYGALLVFPKLQEVVELGGSKPNTTNNEMELTAVVSALGYASNNTEPVQVFTDSQYVLNGVQKWMWNWKKNGWKKQDGEPIANQALWEILYDLVSERGPDTITWNHTPGHVGIIGNERVDDIARELAEGKDVELYRGSLTTYPLDNILDIEIDEEASQKKSHAKAKAYSYLSMVDGVIERHTTWTETEARVKGVNAKFRKATSAQEEQDIIREWSGN